MFARIKKSGNYKYLQIVETYRTYGRVTQKTIASLGRLDRYTEGLTLFELGHSFIDLYQKLSEKQKELDSKKGKRYLPGHGRSSTSKQHANRRSGK